MAEVIKCPNCQRELRLPEQYLGQKVQCPECQHTFIAASMAVSPQPVPPPAAPKPKLESNPAWSDDEDEDDDRRSRRRRRERDDLDDDDDDFDDFPSRRGLRNRLNPHRGGMILALGLVALVGGWVLCAPAVVGPFAWILGSMDLRAIHDGRMDPSGEGMTRAGQICGIIATVLLILVSLFVCGIIALDMH